MFCSLARQCAQLWVETREKLGHPLGTYEDANLIYPHVSEKPSREVFHLHDFEPLSVFEERKIYKIVHVRCCILYKTKQRCLT